MTTPASWPLVDHWVDAALYDPDTGFYETGGRAGKRGGSFVTSPEVGPLFGAVVSNAIDALWRAAGQPGRWIVVDAGAGPATLAKAILLAEPDCIDDLEIICVERSAAQRKLHPSTVESTDKMPGRADVVIANELLDNLPFGLEELVEGAWVGVRVGPDGQTAPDEGGQRRPTVDIAIDWVHWARSVAPHVIAFDYCDTIDNLTERPWTDWVRAFRDHERVEDPFVDAGSRDVTVVVPHDLLPEPTRISSQAGWLARHGIGDLVAAGDAHWQAHAADPGVSDLRFRSRGPESATLTDPRGLGAFTVLEWHG